jgi:hypothetical protein
VLNVEKTVTTQLAYEINDATGFADGSTFDSPEDVRERLMGEDEWAEFVIEHRLHSALQFLNTTRRTRSANRPSPGIRGAKRRNRKC